MSTDSTEATEGEGGTAGYQHWRERREAAAAIKAERDNLIEDRKLMIAADVVATIGSAVTTIRTSLQALPAILAPQVVALGDQVKVRELLAESIEHALEEMARHFAKLAKAPTE